MIGITGSTGHLGRAILNLNPDIEPLDRELPVHPIKILIHTAAPNWKDETAVHLFDKYNKELSRYIIVNKIKTVINVGSWWQYGRGNCQDLPYTALKHRQQAALSTLDINLITIIPFSIYGDQYRQGRGFIPQLVQAIKTKTPIQGLSHQPRDFIHVNDVAEACLHAPTQRTGIYVAATRHNSSPKEIAKRYGIEAPEYLEHPTATPRYFYYWMPGWRPRITLHKHIENAIR
jgi:nucleoside-diphosphate-sugar epimerase